MRIRVGGLEGSRIVGLEDFGGLSYLFEGDSAILVGWVWIGLNAVGVARS